ncbi:type 1 glutamine amidotransferase [Arthrobacter ulcerisalmonis]|nr:type 1 glutamine amidotransferase [Arthrobacter ulcerisalmonis]
MTAMPDNALTALLLTGEGRYADPWHPFPDTSGALAGLLREAGFAVVISGDVDEALADLAHADNVDLPSLLAVNVGLPRDGRPSPGTPEGSAGLARWLGSDRPLLVTHSSSTSFADLPAWEEGLGGRWVRGTSMHPDYGPAAVSVLRASGAVVAGIPDFVLPDERYSYLSTCPDITVHATHSHEGRDHPLMWSFERLPAGGRPGAYLL